MTSEPYLIAIDAGSHTIKLVVAKLSLDINDNSRAKILALVKKNSRGIKRGIVTNMSDATNCLAEIVDEAEAVIGMPIREVLVGISGVNVNFSNSKGLIIISRSDNEIVESDIDRVIQDSLNKTYNLNNSDILHTIPRNFIVDNQPGIKYPVGMIGSKLECETLTISVDQGYLRNFIKMFNQANLEVVDKLFTLLISSDFLLSSRQKAAGAILIDIGFNSSSYIVWENEEVLTYGIVPLGSNHITSDLAICLETGIDLAEEIKVNYLDFNKELDPHQTIELFNKDKQSEEVFNLVEAHKYAKYRIYEIFDFIAQDLKKINRYGQLPGGAILIGGGSCLPGIDRIANRVINLPVFKHTFDPNKVEFLDDYQDDLTFVNAIALASYTLINEDKIQQSQKYTNKTISSVIVADKENFFTKLWEFFKKLLPWS